MGREMVTESWFGSLWWNSSKCTPENDKAAIGVLAFEVAGLMSKVVNLWKYLSDQEITKLKEEIVDSVGIKNFVADDDDYLMDLALNEIMDNFRLISRSVARLASKCTDPLFRCFERFVNDPNQNSLEWFGWEYRMKKMERKVKKMERFVGFTMQLSEELEVLAELEQTLRRIQANPDLNRMNLLESRQRVLWQRQEVMHLREMSPWSRTYDYTVRLLARSLLTILERIKHVFENNDQPSIEGHDDCDHMNADCLPRTRSFSALMQSSVHPFSSGPLGRSYSKSGPTAEKNKMNKKQQVHHQSSAVLGRLKSKRLASVGPFKECMMSGSDSPIPPTCKPAIGGSMRLTGDHIKYVDKMKNSNNQSLPFNNRIYSKLALFSSNRGLLVAPSSTLGDAALALHYANVIVLVEKLVLSPHLVDSETRDGLYNMLPTTIRGGLRARLKAFAKSHASCVYDASLAADWSLALKQILEWLSPLAHNMIRWQSERNFEKEQEVSRTNVLLVQTLHYADKFKTEVAIMELLVGLNYICRINRGLNQRTPPEFFGSRPANVRMLKRDH